MLSKNKIGKLLQTVVFCMVFVLFNQQILLAKDLIRLDILSVNDFHGALLQEGKTPGGAILSSMLKELRLQNSQGTIILSGGDMFQGTVRSNILYGKPVVQMMNETNFAAMVLGNHEFDWGLDSLRANSKLAKFPMLAANIVDKTTRQGVDFAKPYTIINVNGLKVAIIGLITPQTQYTTNIKVVSQYSFLNPAQVVKNIYKEVKAKGADVVIALGHLDYYFINGVYKGEAVELIDELYDTQYKIDAVISAHSHKTAKLKRHNIPLVQAGSNGRYIGRITLYFSKEENKVVDSSVEVLSVLPTQKPDRRVEKIINRSAKVAKPIENKIIGQTTGILHDRYNLSPLGMWISDCLRQKVDAKVAFYNGGGLRKSLEKGAVTLGNIYEIIPFDNTIVTMDLTGEQIIQLLEFGLTSQSGILQYSGLNVVYDKNQPQGAKIVSVMFTGGELLLKDKLYRICTNDFLADGGDGFTFFTKGANIVNTNIVVRDVLVDAIKSAGTVSFKKDNRLQIAMAQQAA